MSTQFSTVQSTIAAQPVLNLPDILIDFGTTNITSMSQLRAAFADMLNRAAAVAGLTN
jgi:hypothetical protein